MIMIDIIQFPHTEEAQQKRMNNIGQASTTDASIKSLQLPHGPPPN
jgi:hypothetical protein